MKLTVINSNSAGNCYILESSSGEALMIECGVNFNDIKKALRFNLKRVIGCIISHEHKDHCKSILDVMNYGISCYATKGTFSGIPGVMHRANAIEPGKKFVLSEFSFMAFDVQHDANEPVGFMINHEECGSIIFLTDSYYCEYTFKGLNNIIIEANYCQTILDRRVESGSGEKFLRDRVIESHMSLQTCKELLQANDLSQVNNIVLIHLSDSNSDAIRFKREVEEVTGKTVHVADAGLVIDFNKTAY